jgi:hypothetical protein
MTKKKSKQLPLQNVVQEYKEASPHELWYEGVLMNFTYGLLQGSLISFIALRADIVVLLSYLMFYFFLGKIVNRPKYVTDLGKFIVFPIPTTLGAFLGYKLAPYITTLFQQ